MGFTHFAFIYFQSFSIKKKYTRNNRVLRVVARRTTEFVQQMAVYLMTQI